LQYYRPSRNPGEWQFSARSRAFSPQAGLNREKPDAVSYEFPQVGLRRLSPVCRQPQTDRYGRSA